MTTLREDLKAWRQRLGITQAKAAKILDVPLPTYQGWEGGRRFDREKILRLAMSRVEAILVDSVRITDEVMKDLERKRH